MAKYGVFIIESLSLDDEKGQFRDGFVLKQMLSMCQIENEYYYIRTERELSRIIKIFKKSDLRYLHLSCHANSNSLGLTFDTLTYKAFGEVVGNYLAGKRIFISACEASNSRFAKELISKYKCLSIIGSPIDVEFAQAATFWSGFYYNMDRIDTGKMSQPDILNEIEILSDAFEIPINYYSFRRKNKKFLPSEIREHKIIPKKDTISRIIKVRQTNGISSKRKKT